MAHEDEMPQVPDWLQAILKIGVPGAIAVFLVWRLAGGFDLFDTRLRSIETQHSELAASVVRVEGFMGRSAVSIDRVVMVLRQICVQNAATAADRRDCLKEN